MSDEKLVPELRFPGFDEEWNKIPLNKLLSFKNGLNATSEKYGSGTKFINVSDILDNNYITYGNINDSVKVTDNEFENYKIEYGDIVFQRSSETREEVGTANVYLSKKPCIYGGFVIRGKKNGNYEPYFLKELLQTTRVRKEITSWSGGSTRYNIGQDSLNKISIFVPSINEQKIISKFICFINNKIDLLKLRCKNYHNFKKYLMQHLFSQNLRFNSENEWELQKGKDVFKLVGGGSFNSSDSVKNGVKWLKIANVGVNTIKKEEISYLPQEFLKTYENFILRKGDIVIALTGSILDHKLKIAIIDDEFNNSLLNQRVGKIEVNKDVDSKFIYYSLQTYESICYLESKIAGSAPPNLSNKDLLKIPIYVPPKTEQEKINYTLTNVDNKINLIDYHISKYEEFRKCLIQKMFV